MAPNVCISEDLFKKLSNELRNKAFSSGLLIGQVNVTPLFVQIFSGSYLLSY